MCFKVCPGWGENLGAFSLFSFIYNNTSLIYVNSFVAFNRTERIRHQSRKTTVLNCHRCLINTGVEKKNNIEI